MRINRKEGFTLVELLVVIAIIGILAGLMFPAISGAIEQANSTKIANQAKNIATGIMTENMQREAQNEGTIWPGDAYDIYNPDSGEVAKQVTADTYSDSSNYFDDLIENKVVESLTSYGSFAGGGVRQPSGTQKLKDNKDYNIWSCVSVQAGSVSGDAPFIFTRNLLPDTEGLKDNETIDNNNRWNGGKNDKHWDSTLKPFSNSRCVYATRGGAVSQTRAKDMTPVKFWGDAKFSSVNDVKLLKAHEN